MQLILPQSISAYHPVMAALEKLPDEKKVAAMRNLARHDLYFLLRYVFSRADMEHPWLFERCREVQASPNGHLDLWFRAGYKSTIITYGLTVQDILTSHGEDPDPKWRGLEPTFGIFSHTRPIAKSFLRQIKRELEANNLLRALFPDIIWDNPNREAPKWSEDDGIIVKRNTNPKESTVEAWGMVDSQPTGKHFYARVYDDVVTTASVATPDMMRKTTSSWELSLNLGQSDGIERYIGTRYHHNDTYREILARQVAKPRIKPVTDDGNIHGKAVFLTQEEVDKKRRQMGPYTFSTQMLLDPLADEVQGFKREWLQYYETKPEHTLMNRYILVDPANEKKRESDYTAMWVVGLNSDENFYILDMVRDRLRLTERADLIFKLHRKWKPLQVVYEKYGMQADIEHCQDRMERENYRFQIVAVGGTLAKADRIKRLVPKFEQKRFYFPHFYWATLYDGTQVDLIRTFIEEEYAAFPVAVHEDMLDALSRIEDINLVWPDAEYTVPLVYPELNIV